MRFSVLAILLAVTICSSAQQVAGPAEKDKAAVLRQEARNWIDVGQTQMKRGLYQQAGQSFMAAYEYQQYLSAEESKKLEEDLKKAYQGSIEGQTVLEELAQARDLLKQGQPVKARAHYEKIRKSPYLTEQQRKQIAEDLKAVDAAFDKKRKEITELYNRSVEAYRAGELEKARDGFSEVIKSGMLVAPKGQSAEDYLVQIDSILTARLKGPSAPKPPAPGTAEPSKTPSDIIPSQVLPPSQAAESVPVQTEQNQQPVVQEKKIPEKPQTKQEEAKEVTTAVETTPEKEPETGAIDEARINIIRNYTKAVVDDAAGKVEYFIAQQKFDKALDTLRNATELISENRPFIGDDAFIEYAMRLKKLTERIIQTRKRQ